MMYSQVKIILYNSLSENTTARSQSDGGRRKGHTGITLFHGHGFQTSTDSYFSIPRDFKNASLLGGRPKNFVK